MLVIEDILPRELTEPAIFVTDVAKQHDEVVRGIDFGVLVSTRASFWLDEITRKPAERFNGNLPQSEPVPRVLLLKSKVYSN